MRQNDLRWKEGLLRRLIGRDVSSVEFVRDYVQLRFDGPTLTAVTTPSVSAGGRVYRWKDGGYRDMLCGRIGKHVTAAEIVANEYLRLCFEDGVDLSISLRPDDYDVAEAATFTFDDENWWEI